jgi:hypothetical protein
LAKSQLIRAGRALSMTLYMGIGSATFICVNRGVILIYFTVKEGIKPFETKIEVFN